MKWRWHLEANAHEDNHLHVGLESCGWPRVAKPKRAVDLHPDALRELVRRLGHR